MSPPREVLDRLSSWSALRKNSKWGEFEATVTPIFHRGLTSTSWGPMPVGLSDESKRLHLQRLKLFFLVFLRDECTEGERIVADVFRRHRMPPPHLSAAEIIQLESAGSWELTVEAIERTPFERISVPDVDHMELPAVSFVSPTGSALERLLWLGLNPDHYSFDANPPERSGPKPEMARDRRSKRIAARNAARVSADSDTGPNPASTPGTIVVPMEPFSRYRSKRSRRDQ